MGNINIETDETPDVGGQDNRPETGSGAAEKDIETIDTENEEGKAASPEPEETSGEEKADAEAEQEPEDAGDEEAKEEASPDGKAQKHSFFGKKKKETEKYQQQIDDLTDRLKRSLAEFDNYRKRTEKEKSSMYVIGARDVVERILPVVDSFERGLSSAPEGDSFADGMRLIYKQLMAALEDMGVKAIEAVGKEFNPDFHNAVMHVEDENAGENIIVEEFQKGYTYKDTVVRHSMVKVAN